MTETGDAGAEHERRGATGGRVRTSIPVRSGRRLWIFGAAVLVAAPLLAAWSWHAAQGTGFRYEIVKEFPHDTNAYCQGLVFADGMLLEGTGRYGQSSLRRVRLETGEVVEQVDLDTKYFGEGIALLGDKIYQITWRENTAFEYDKNTLKPTGKTFRYAGEGWGLTADGHSLILSDGTSVLRFLDPETFQVRRQVTVRDGRERVTNLNELEFIDGQIFANVWRESHIVRINPRSGAVTGTVSLRGLRSGTTWTGEEVLNGIAYDAEHKRIFVTGKNWAKVYEIRIVRDR
ncbi:MAG: glutaminyl-peptide cyclotransferase [Planctomycetes bacterium]|nr:glutaminyl-peptide cyclotransferase [Planctomycetota bacterium]